MIHKHKIAPTARTLLISEVMIPNATRNLNEKWKIKSASHFRRWRNFRHQKTVTCTPKRCRCISQGSLHRRTGLGQTPAREQSISHAAGTRTTRRNYVAQIRVCVRERERNSNSWKNEVNWAESSARDSVGSHAWFLSVVTPGVISVVIRFNWRSCDTAIERPPWSYCARQCTKRHSSVWVIRALSHCGGIMFWLSNCWANMRRDNGVHTEIKIQIK